MTAFDYFYRDELWFQFWTGLGLMGVFAVLLFILPANSGARLMLSWLMLCAFLYVAYAVINLAGGFTSFLGIVSTIVTIIGGLFGIIVNINQLQSHKDKT